MRRDTPGQESRPRTLSPNGDCDREGSTWGQTQVGSLPSPTDVPGHVACPPFVFCCGPPFVHLAEAAGAEASTRGESGPVSEFRGSWPKRGKEGGSQGARAGLLPTPAPMASREKGLDKE